MNTQQKSFGKVLKIISQSEKYRVVSVKENEDSKIRIRVRLKYNEFEKSKYEPLPSVLVYLND